MIYTTKFHFWHNKLLKEERRISSSSVWRSEKRPAPGIDNLAVGLVGGAGIVSGASYSAG